jgi:hypothetical protein
MNREEILSDIKQAQQLGDSELELKLLEKLDSLPESQPAPADTGNPVMNALYGAAARGNQAMAAINPWANQEKIAAEQEWVKQHPGAGVGQTLADVAMTLPAGGAPSALGRALLTGAIEGSTTPGSLLERNALAGQTMTGSLLGEGVGKAVGFLVHPFKEAASPVVKHMVAKAKALGIPLTAAQTTGNKALQYADSALDFIPSSSTAQQEFKDQQRKAWTKALFSQGDEIAESASPDVMGAMKDRISGVYNDIAGRNAMRVDDVLKADLGAVKANLMERIPVNQKGIVKSYLKDFDKPPVGAEISGKTYQDIRSMLDKQAKGFKNSDPATAQALLEIRSAVDAAMERSLTNPARVGGNADDLANWRKANKDWLVMKNIEKTVDPVTGDVSAAKLMNNLSRSDANRVIYGKGDQELTDIAKLGKQFITPKTADSGTAQRAMMMRLLTGGGLGGLGTMALYDPVTAAEAGTAALLGGVLLPKAAGAMMRNQGGYLTKGLVDLSKEALPGISRQKVISELMRNAGLEAMKGE